MRIISAYRGRYIDPSTRTTLQTKAVEVLELNQTVPYAIFRIQWNNDEDIDISLTAPDLTVYTPSDADVTVFYRKNLTINEAYYAVPNPQVGTWQINIPDTPDIGEYVAQLIIPREFRDAPCVSFGTLLDKLICRLNLERVLGRLSNQYFKECPSNMSSRPEALTLSGDDNRLSVHYNENGRYPVSSVISIDDPLYPTFGNAPVNIAGGDFNGDGLPDIAVITTISQLLQDGPDILVLLNGIKGGVSSIPSIVDLPEGLSGIVSDKIAGSSADDIGIIYTGSSISGAPMGIGLNLGVNGGMPEPVQFASLNGLPSDIVAFNINSDGTRNLAVLRDREGFTAGISIFSVRNDGKLTYLGDLILGSDNILDFDVSFAYVMTSVDMNGDKRKDLVAVTRNMGGANGIISVIINNGDLNFTLVRQAKLGASCRVKVPVG